MANYYVSTTGDDTNDGKSTSTTFRTIAKAVGVVQPGDMVLIRGGTYNVPVSPSTSGTAVSPITFAAYLGELPIVDGLATSPGNQDAVKISAAWKPSHERLLIEDSSPQTWARVATIP